MNTKIWLVFLACVTNTAYALNSINSAPVAVVKMAASAVTTNSGDKLGNSIDKNSTISVNANNLTGIDNNADDLIQLKRKLELEKAQAEIKKFRGGSVSGTNNSNSTIVQDNVQTTVTGVAINHDGKKIAWLQFADGGSLTVNIGSQVGKYIVSDITMTGVRLSTNNSKSKAESVFLKRAYYAPEKAKNQSNSNNKSFFSPSPIITGSNTGDDSDMVPPIVSIR